MNSPIDHANAVWRQPGGPTPAALAGAIEAHTQELRAAVDAAQVRMVGNSVAPPLMEAMVLANVPEMRIAARECAA